MMRKHKVAVHFLERKFWCVSVCENFFNIATATARKSSLVKLRLLRQNHQKNCETILAELVTSLMTS